MAVIRAKVACTREQYGKVLVVRVDSAGTVLWAMRAGGTSTDGYGYHDVGLGIASDTMDRASRPSRGSYDRPSTMRVCRT